MKVGMIGTGAIAHKHAQAYRNIGFDVAVCTDKNEMSGEKFAESYGTRFVRTFEEVCSHPTVDFVDVCTLPDFRLPAVTLCAQNSKHVQVQKPIAINLEIAREMIDTARRAKINLGVVSQHRFDDSSLFLAEALAAGRLGRILECDCYVKWTRPAEYYARKGKGMWAVEGGGALINQAIHQVDLMRWLVGPVATVYGEWQLGAVHKIESEDIVNAVVRYSSGATGVIQASTAYKPGYPERLEFHGEKGTAILTGDKITSWDVENYVGPEPPLMLETASGASDPMAISLEPFERQFLDFAEAITAGRSPRVSGEDGYEALRIVEAIYSSCRSGLRVSLS